MHECILTWCAYNCNGYCYMDPNSQFHYYDLACDPPEKSVPTQIKNELLRRNAYIRC